MVVAGAWHDLTMSGEHDVYTHGHSDAVLRSHRWRTAENSAAYLLPHLASGQRLLDVGCGPGTLTVDLARRVAPAEVIGIDVSADVIAEATATASAAAVSHVTFRAGDFRDAGFEPGSFDVVHAHQVLQHLRDPVGALRDMSTLAGPHGLVAVRDSDYSAFAWAPEDGALDRWLEVYLAVARRNGAEPDAGRWLRRWAFEAGLSDVRYTTSTWTYATDDDVAWWSDLWAQRTESSALAEQAVAYGISTAAELADIAAGWRRWGQAEASVFIVVHGEVIAGAGAQQSSAV